MAGDLFMDKTLIEVGSFELIKLFNLVSKESKIEKNAMPPINEGGGQGNR